MKTNTANEAVIQGNETAGKCTERSRSLTGADQVNQRNWTSTFATFAVGVGIGALAGLLFAPASGKRTRNYITRAVNDGLDDAASTGKRWSRSAQKTVDDVKANLTGVVEAGQKAYRTARDA
jgi:gas vesicle protein